MDSVKEDFEVESEKEPEMKATIKLSVSAQLPFNNKYSLKINLAYPVIVEQCYHKVLASKIEIKLKKQEDIMWPTLEGEPDVLNAKEPPSESGIERKCKYPSSSKIYKDWNKIEKEIEKQEAAELTDSETAINSLFQKIYGGGSDEVRRAMNKSFIESGGTVLSTNWGEVEKQPVQKKPPAGMEWKSWNS
ncbi:protein SGT1 homolog isoform X2 [Linepithema humile]|uniref:protein SGT1 homolog isoform X2 n=1 Tax=Linepithema humile TaxID=83485 RepID=UPI00351E7AE5